MDADIAHLFRDYLRAREDAAADPDGPDSIARFATAGGLEHVDLARARLAERLAREIAHEQAGQVLNTQQLADLILAKGADPLAEGVLGPRMALGCLVGTVVDYAVADDSCLALSLEFRRRRCQPDARYLMRRPGESDELLEARALQVLIADRRERDCSLGPVHKEMRRRE